MPTIDLVETYPCPPARLFAALRRPAALVALAPPEFGLSLLDGPEVLELGSRYTVQARRWGMTQKVVSAVVECLPDESLIEEQERGPLRRWRLTRRFRPVGEGTELAERIEFDPPGGLLGLTLTAARIEADVRAGHAWRRERLLSLVAEPHST